MEVNPVPHIADALTFGVSAVCLSGVRAGPEPRPARASRPRIVSQIAEGLEPWRHGGFMLPMLAVAATMNFAMMGVFALRIVFLVRTEGARQLTFPCHGGRSAGIL